MDMGYIFLAGTKDFSLLKIIQTDSGAHPASSSVGTTDLSPGIMQPV